MALTRCIFSLCCVSMILAALIPYSKCVLLLVSLIFDKSTGRCFDRVVSIFKHNQYGCIKTSFISEITFQPNSIKYYHAPFKYTSNNV